MDWEILSKIVFQIIFTILLLRISGEIGKLSISNGYCSVSSLSLNRAFSFNIFYRVLYLPIALCLTAILLYVVKLDFLVIDIWLISIWYYILQLFFSINKLFYTYKGLYFGSAILSILLSYFFYTNGIVQGLSNLLPDSSNFRTELWFIVILFFYGLFNTYQLEDSDNHKGKLEKRYLTLKKRYGHLPGPEFQNKKILNDLLFSIMIFEDMNRPKWLRFLEKIFFGLGFVQSSGIMQVKSSHLLNDEESINEAEKIILRIYQNSKDKSDYEISGQVFTEYNPDAYYRNEVRNLFWQIQQISEFLEEIKFQEDRKR